MVEIDIFAPANRSATSIFTMLRQQLRDEESGWIETIGVVTATEREAQPLARIRLDRDAWQAWIDDPSLASGNWQGLVDHLERTQSGCVDWEPWVDVVAAGFEDWSSAPACGLTPPK